MTVQSFFSRVSSAAIAIALVAGSARRSPRRATPSPHNGWGIKLTDVTPDPAIKYGTLPNGMKYAIMRNATPRGTASVRLRFEFGSIAGKRKRARSRPLHRTYGVQRLDPRPRGRHGQDPRAPGARVRARHQRHDRVRHHHLHARPPQGRRRLSTPRSFLFREVAGELKFDPDGRRPRARGHSRPRSAPATISSSHQLRRPWWGSTIPRRPIPNRLPIGVDSVLKERVCGHDPQSLSALLPA